MFTLTTDRAEHLLHMHLSGFFTVPEVDELRQEVQSLVRRMGWHVSAFDTLVTSSKDFIQSPAVVEAMRQVMGDPRYKARRIAVVRASMLAQMQAKRIVQQDRTRIFADVDEAKAWLREARA